MTKIIKQRQKSFTVVDNSVIRDGRLSWKARGIFAYLWSQSDDWNYFTSEVAKHSPDGLTALHTGLRELEKYGYLTRKRTRDERGRISSSDWIISEKPAVKKPHIENQHVENRTLRSTNLKNYQQQEILTESKRYSPAKAEPPLPYSEIVDYMNDLYGTHFRASSEATKKLIRGKLNEGFTVDDFKLVIAGQWLNWKDDQRMKKFLVPKTIFRASNFEGYLENAKRRKNIRQDLAIAKQDEVNTEELPF